MGRLRSSLYLKCQCVAGFEMYFRCHEHEKEEFESTVVFHFSLRCLQKEKREKIKSTAKLCWSHELQGANEKSVGVGGKR